MADALTPDDLGPEFQAKVTTQRYDAAPSIDGVRRADLRLLNDDGGAFAELARFTLSGELEAFPGFQIRQASFSLLLPRVVKAFHLHYAQDDVWFVPPTDRLLVGLLDTRHASPSYNVSQRLILGAGKAQLLFIPRGVAHGAVNLGIQPASVLYFVNQQFALENPDECRLPWDVLGREFWESAPG